AGLGTSASLRMHRPAVARFCNPVRGRRTDGPAPVPLAPVAPAAPPVAPWPAPPGPATTDPGPAGSRADVCQPHRRRRARPGRRRRGGPAPGRPAVEPVHLLLGLLQEEEGRP